MKKIRLLKVNNKGFTLVSTLTASAIGLIIVTGLSSMVVQMSKQVARINDKALYADLFEEIKSDFIRKKLCDNFYKG